MQFKTNISGLSDIELIYLYKDKGDKAMVGELYKRYTRFAFSICMKYLRDEEASKDAAMQVFEKLFDDLKRHQVTNFKSWLHTVLRNHCLHIIRDNAYKLAKEKEAVDSYENLVENQFHLYQDNDNGFEEKIDNLEMELCNLSHEQRSCIELFYLKDKCYQEVAEITGYTMNQVKSHIQNGKRNLKISLEQNERG
ncbi:MAG: sigma-70 family RNA polymerase sigma factor [Bacteroidales bacterium]|nr:MAG: sigma-70 family RNA polymerase sigma factor [Bacteroidales bacterium]